MPQSKKLKPTKFKPNKKEIFKKASQPLDDVQHAWRQDVSAFGENVGQFSA
jgi:hypothetical protein